jgi:WD40 repeat protein
MALSGSRDSKARLWDLKTGLPVGQPLRHVREVKHVELSHDSRIALTICADYTAHLWDIQSCKPLARPMRFETGIKDGAFSSDGSTILFQCADGTARLYNVPQPLEPKLIRAWSRARTGFEVTDQGVQRLSQSQWLAAEEELTALEKPQ